MGDRDREPGAHRRDRRARLRHRPAGPPGAGGHRPARGHPARPRRPRRRSAPVVAGRAALDPAFVETVAQRLRKAERPMLILGGSGWTDEAALTAIGDWAERLDLPVALSFRRKDLISNDHPCYAGDLGLGPNPKLVARVKDADLLLVDRRAPGREPDPGLLPARPARARPETLIHIHPGPEELGRVWPTAAGAVGRRLARGPGPVDHRARTASGRPGRGRARRLRRLHRTPVAGDATVNLSRSHGAPGRGAAARRHRHQRRGQLRRLAAPLLPPPRPPHPAGPDLGRHGLRLPGRHRRQAHPPRPRGRSASPATATS